MNFKGCISCRKCEFIRGSAFCGADKLTEKQLYNDKGYCSDFEEKVQAKKPSWWWKCERCGKLIPYMADFCRKCADDIDNHIIGSVDTRDCPTIIEADKAESEE